MKFCWILRNLHRAERNRTKCGHVWELIFSAFDVALVAGIVTPMFITAVENPIYIGLNVHKIPASPSIRLERLVTRLL